MERRKRNIKFRKEFYKKTGVDLNEIDDNVIVVQELSEKEDCRCICLYDVDFLLNNVEKGIYTIAIKELYIEEALWLQFDIDLNESTSGVFKQTREFYPWGV